MKRIKQKLAVLLAALLLMQGLSAMATEPQTGGTVETQATEESPAEESSVEESSEEESSEVESSEEESSEEESSEEASDTEESSIEENTTEETDEAETEETETDETETETDETETEETETEEEKEKSTVPSDEVRFNTGSCVFSVVGREDFFDNELGDAPFEEDGSYTINIPEDNPFFPYEVQFTYKGEVTNEWFMTPDDSVTVGGHTFRVSAYFDGTVVTQMSLKVGGNTVVVYPEKKEFTDGDGIEALSLLPLDHKYLTVDLSGYTPAELTMVSFDSIFTGATALTDMDKVVWGYRSDDDYVISSSGDKIDLSYYTYSGGTTWEMIVGDGDQLTDTNKRYDVRIQTTRSEDWLIPTVYVQDKEGNRSPIDVTVNRYNDYNTRWQDIYVSLKVFEDDVQAYLALDINSASFPNMQVDHFEIYEGMLGSVSETSTRKNITDIICNADMGQKDAGYLLHQAEPPRNLPWITMVTYDTTGNVTGFLPFYLYFSGADNHIYVDAIYDRSQTYSRNVGSSRSGEFKNGCYYITQKLDYGYAANSEYYLALEYWKAGAESVADVTAAFVGNYGSIGEAMSKGATDIKSQLFDSNYNSGGYPADYSQGIEFSIFVGDDGNQDQEIYHYNIKTEEGEKSLSSNTSADFYGLKDKNGNDIPCYVVAAEEDSYAEHNYRTIFVNEGTDLSSLAPLFTESNGRRLYTGGSSTPEVSGQSLHDFSNGPVQYTVAAENGKDSKNYWLQVVCAESGVSKLYVNSLADSEAKTNIENGVTYSIRELLLDDNHDGRHDILLANIGTEAIPGLSVELVSDSVALDAYWTLSGKNALDGISTLTGNDDLSNLAKIRLKAKAGVEEGTEVTGTLTIRSDGTDLMVFNLTGTIGNPVITTKEIPAAVKYVPYGTIIQNNNKYRQNKVSYRLVSGRLPGGMEVRENGEIYGVPTETGEFTFTVTMQNSYASFLPSTREFILTVLENTDANVDGATDQGYDLTQRVGNIYLAAADTFSGSQLMVSQGIFDEFVDIFLDGNKLVQNVDYEAESGSTRITLRNQTLRAANTPGTHTLGIEFRTGDEKTLRRAAQNYLVIGNTPGTIDTPENNGNGSNGGNSGNNGSDEDGGADSAAVPGTIAVAPKQPTAGLGANAALQIPLPENTGTEAIFYTVQKGDTLWKIAQRYYGSGSYWQKIYQDNSQIIQDPNRIYAGQVLLIYLTANTNVVSPTDGQADTAAGTETGVADMDPNATYYTVQDGDNLWKIAVKFYGKGWRWRRILHANDSIRDPKYIYKGQVLLIPDV